MREQTKHRLIGVIVILAIAAIFLPLLFYHPLPGMKRLGLSAKLPKAPSEPKLLYDIPLKGQVVLAHQTFVPIDETSQADLRKRALKTTRISGEILHAAKPTQNKENLKVSPAIVNKPRDLHKNTVLLNSSEAMVPKAWVIQLASFGDKSNADRLANVLRKLGLDSYTRASSSPVGNITRVYVGPYIKYDKVTSIREFLQERLQLKGVIRKYNL